MLELLGTTIGIITLGYVYLFAFICIVYGFYALIREIIEISKETKD